MIFVYDVWLSMTISRSIHVAFFGSFLWLVFHCIFVLHLLYSFTDEHLGCFHVLAIVNFGMLQWTLGCLHPFELWFSPNTCPGIGLLDQMVTLVLVGRLPHVKPASSRKVGNRFNFFSDGPLQRPNFQEWLKCKYRDSSILSKRAHWWCHLAVITGSYNFIIFFSH